MLVCSMTQELIANLLRVHRKGITSLPVTCTHLYVCLRTDPLSFECYNSLASFRNYVSTSGIGPATFFLSRLVILQRGRRSCSLSVRSRPSIRLSDSQAQFMYSDGCLGNLGPSSKTEGRKMSILKSIVSVFILLAF